MHGWGVSERLRTRAHAQCTHVPLSGSAAASFFSHSVTASYPWYLGTSSGARNTRTSVTGHPLPRSCTSSLRWPATPPSNSTREGAATGCTSAPARCAVRSSSSDMSRMLVIGAASPASVCITYTLCAARRAPARSAGSASDVSTSMNL